MEENDKKRETLEKAKTIMGKIDPGLLLAALSEMMIEADEAEEADVAKVKKAIKGIYDSIPEGKDKTSIVSKAIMELDSEIIKKEVKVIKESLASIDKETIMEAAKDFVGMANFPNRSACTTDVYHYKCFSCINVVGPMCMFGCIKYAVEPPCVVGSCIKFFIGCIHCGLQYIVKPVDEGEIYPLIKKQFTEEIIQEVLQRPELSRAMKKMLKKIQDEK